MKQTLSVRRLENFFLPSKSLVHAYVLGRRSARRPAWLDAIVNVLTVGPTQAQSELQAIVEASFLKLVPDTSYGPSLVCTPAVEARLSVEIERRLPHVHGRSRIVLATAVVADLKRMLSDGIELLVEGAAVRLQGGRLVVTPHRAAPPRPAWLKALLAKGPPVCGEPTC